MPGSAFAPQSRPGNGCKFANSGISTRFAARLKHELRRLGEARQQGRGRIEHRLPRHVSGNRPVNRRPSGCSAEHACQPPAVLELSAQALGKDLCRAVEQNDVERGLCRRARRERTDHDRDVRGPNAIHFETSSFVDFALSVIDWLVDWAIDTLGAKTVPGAMEHAITIVISTVRIFDMA